MKCKDCTVFNCQYRTTDAEKDCYYEIQYTAKEQFDWQSFRAEAAKGNRSNDKYNDGLLSTRI